MQINKQTYKSYAKRRAAPSPIVRDCARAFVCGGGICTFGEILFTIYTHYGASDETARTLVSCSLIVLAGLATGLGFFDKAAKFAGAGTLVPITGFANSVVSPAIDNKAEGMVTGVGAKIFIVAGPVIMYGTIASVIYGVIVWLMNLISG